MRSGTDFRRVLSLLVLAAMLASLMSFGVWASEEPLTDELIEEETALDETESEAAAAEAGETEDAGTGEAEAEEVAAEEAEATAFDGAGPGGTPPGGSLPGGGGGSSGISWTGAATITSGATVSNGSYSSSTDRQNALLINTKDTVTLIDPTASKTGAGGNSDNYSFYGVNAAIMVKGGTTTTITGGTVNTTASGANGVFSYGGNGGRNGAAGDGTTVIIRETKITTTGSGSGGIMTTGGGVTYAYDLDITTGGGSSAAIRTDRGGGTVAVDGGRYATTGLGSPAIYSTADVTVKNATLISELSEGVCIEGKNSVTLENCDLTANNTRMNGNAQFLDSIMIYQSFSGDSSVGGSSFTMTGGRLTSQSGHVFHVTNTTAAINLSGVEIVNEYGGTYKTLLSVCGDGWSGAQNIATVNADAQTLEGGLLVGSDSTLNLNLKNGSKYTGYFYGVITNYKGSTVSTSLGTVNITLDETSKLYLQADANVASFSGPAENVVTNGHTLYVNGVALAGITEWEDGAEYDPHDVDQSGKVDVMDASAAITEDVWTAVQILRQIIGLA